MNMDILGGFGISTRCASSLTLSDLYFVSEKSSALKKRQLLRWLPAWETWLAVARSSDMLYVATVVLPTSREPPLAGSVVQVDSKPFDISSCFSCLSLCMCHDFAGRRSVGAL